MYQSPPPLISFFGNLGQIQKRVWANGKLCPLFSKILGPPLSVSFWFSTGNVSKLYTIQFSQIFMFIFDILNNVFIIIYFILIYWFILNLRYGDWPWIPNFQLVKEKGHLYMCMAICTKIFRSSGALPWPWRAKCEFIYYLFIYLCLSLFIYLFIYSFIYLSIYLFIYLCIYLFVYLFIYLFISLLIHSFIYLSIDYFIYLFIHSFIYLFIYSYIYSFMYLLIYFLFIYKVLLKIAFKR